MISGGKTHGCIAAHGLPRLMGARLVPMPCCFRRASTSSPWLAIDPVLRADCMAFCRNVRLTFVAVFALLGLSKMACAAGPAANRVQTDTVDLPAQNRSVELASAVECANHRVPKLAISAAPFGRKTPLTVGTLFNMPCPEAPRIDMERAHAPPAAHVPVALFRISIYFARSSLTIPSNIFPLSGLPLPVPFPSFTNAPRLISPPHHFGGSAMLRSFARATALVSLIPTSPLGEIAYVYC
jgi:hypothetical protein